MREPELLFQRQRLDEFVVVWDGRAGHYLNYELLTIARAFPPHAPNGHDDLRLGICLKREKTGAKLLREQRIARGLCPACDNRLRGLELTCFVCRRRSNAQRKRQS